MIYIPVLVNMEPGLQILIPTKLEPKLDFTGVPEGIKGNLFFQHFFFFQKAFITLDMNCIIYLSFRLHPVAVVIQVCTRIS